MMQFSACYFLKLLSFTQCIQVITFQNTLKQYFGYITTCFKEPAQIIKIKNEFTGGFPGGAVVENLPADAGDTGSSPGLGRSHMPRSD